MCTTIYEEMYYYYTRTMGSNVQKEYENQGTSFTAAHSVSLKSSLDIRPSP